MEEDFSGGKMNVIITGGTGLIGRALVESLVRDGHHVAVLSRDPAFVKGMPGQVQLVKWDGTTSRGWGNLVDGADAVINLAGQNLSSGRWTSRRKQEIIDSRVNAGKAVVEAIGNAVVKPRVLIQASGIGAYGTSETELFDEGASYGKDFLAEVTKVWEASTRPVESLGVRRVVIRTAAVLSTASGALPKVLLPFRFFVGGPLGSGRQWLSWIHLEDEVRAIRFLLEHPEARGVFNLSAQAVTNRQFAGAIGTVLNRPAWISVPSFAIRLLFGEMSTMVLEGQKASNEKLTGLGFQFNFPEVNSALNDLLKQKTNH